MRKVLVATLLPGALLAAVSDWGVPGGLFDYCIGARPYALGKSFTGLADNVETIYFNPAGLAFLQRKYVMGGTYWMPVEDIAYYFAALSFPTATYGSFGVAVNTIEPPEFYVYKDSTMNSVVEFSTVERAGIFSYAKGLTRTLALGGNLKVHWKRVVDRTAAAAGVDLGLLFRPNRTWSLGIACLNFIQPRMTFAEEEIRYPQIWRLGIGIKPLEWFTISFDLAHSSHYQNPKFMGGVEARPLSWLYVRGGADENEVSGGGGLELTVRDVIFNFDAAYTYNHSSSLVFEETQQISMTVRFSGYRVWANADPQLISTTEGDFNNMAYIYLHSFPRQRADEWTLIIMKHTGEVVRTFTGEGDPPVRIEWDGRDDSGRLVPPGSYKYKFQVVDWGGELYERSGYLLTVKKAEVW